MKKLAYFAAVSLVVIAQAASAQTITKPGMPSTGTPITKNGTIKVVTPRTASAGASVTMANGLVWLFNGSGNIASAGATVAGVAVAPGALKAGMNCVLTGTQGAPTGNLIKTLAC